MKRFLGSMLSGAVGDALGYTVEFKAINEIRQIYGENGISDYKLTSGVALISDDTQMTLFKIIPRDKTLSHTRQKVAVSTAFQKGAGG